MIAGTPVDEFLDRLASGAPTPGGGSAAAVMGAMGAALVSMVCNVTLGKKGCEAAAAEMLAVRTDAEQLRLQLTAMVADDIAAFDALLAAYKLPKVTAADQTARTAAIQSSMLRATQVPLECARACAAVIALAGRAGEHGYQGVVSDAGVAVLAAHAALRSAAFNVTINTPALKDRAAAERCAAEMAALAAAAGVAHDSVVALVQSRLTG